MKSSGIVVGEVASTLRAPRILRVSKILLPSNMLLASYRLRESNGGGTAISSALPEAERIDPDFLNDVA